ncbi:MAG: dihydrolipoamide acetyltransferase family protein [Acetobacteraceae bacterium]
MNIIMPQLGETVTEGRITAWFKRIGERVEPGDNLFELETDKAAMEVPATTAGRLTEIRIQAGDTASVGAVVAVIADGPARTAPALLEALREVATPERNYGPAKRADGVAVTPLARRLAAEAGIDLAAIKGQGTHGRITRRDVEAHIQRREPPAPDWPAIESVLAADRSLAAYRDRPHQEIPLERMRRTIARRTLDAARTIPHFHLTGDVDMDDLLALRRQANKALTQHGGGTPSEQISINDLVLKAFALALQAVPDANVVWADDRILRFRHSDIAIAVAAEDGLTTPVLRDVETKSILVIANEARLLAEQARAHRLEPQQCQGGQATVTNLGAHGVREFSAIINPPQSTILAVGAVERRPVETDTGGVAFASRMTVTLGCDHRVIDGMVGAALLAAFRRIIEMPMSIVL